MLKVNVGLSRKLSKDYNSEGFSINIEGEVSAAVNDPQAVVEQVRELQDLAEEALAQQIERAQSTAAIASRDEEPRVMRAMAGVPIPRTIVALRPTAMGTSPTSLRRTSRFSICCASASV